MMSFPYLNGSWSLGAQNHVLKISFQLKQMILQVHRERQKVGLEINMKKTKVMFNNYILDHDIRMYNQVIKCVQDYIYLT